MSIYNSINQRSKSGIEHQHNQPTFLKKIVLIFVLGLLSLKNVTGVGIPKREIHLVSE
jgi:hypothetical protein